MILIVAYGSKYYGRFAYNLAYSIKDKVNIPICLVTDGKTGIDISIFDSVITIETPTDPCLLKINLNKYTPYEKTLYIDADMVCMSNIDNFIKSLENKSLWIDVLRDNTSFWLKEGAIAGQYQDVNSSMLYFTQESDWYFEELNKAYANIDRSLFKNFWGKKKNIPDEALHSIVMSANGIKHNIDGPVFYCDHSAPKQQIIKRLFLSMYGAGIATQDCKDLYDAVINSVMKRAGKSHDFKINTLYKQKFISI
jgi:hypothetical protein